MRQDVSGCEGSGTEESEEGRIGVCAGGRGRGSSPSRGGRGHGLTDGRDGWGGGGGMRRDRAGPERGWGGWGLLAREGGERDEGRHSQGRDPNQEGDRDGKERARQKYRPRQTAAGREAEQWGAAWSRNLGSPPLPSAPAPGTSGKEKTIRRKAAGSGPLPASPNPCHGAPPQTPACEGPLLTTATLQTPLAVVYLRLWLKEFSIVRSIFKGNCPLTPSVNTTP